MKTHALASATLTRTCSPSVAGHFAHCWVSLGASCCQFLILVAVIYSISTCTRIPCRDSHCENGSFEVLSLHSGRSWIAVDGLRHRSPPGVLKIISFHRRYNTSFALSLLAWSSDASISSTFFDVFDHNVSIPDSPRIQYITEEKTWQNFWTEMM